MDTIGRARATRGHRRIHANFDDAESTEVIRYHETDDEAKSGPSSEVVRSHETDDEGKSGPARSQTSAV